jgi:hypothetical protein
MNWRELLTPISEKRMKNTSLGNTPTVETDPFVLESNKKLTKQQTP